jgi:hypothetical protein
VGHRESGTLRQLVSTKVRRNTVGHLAWALTLLVTIARQSNNVLRNPYGLSAAACI